MTRILDIGAFNAVREAGLAKLVPPVPRVAVGMGTCGRGNGAEGLYQAFGQAIETAAETIWSWRRWDASEPVFRNRWSAYACPGSPLVILRRVQANDASRVAA